MDSQFFSNVVSSVLTFLGNTALNLLFVVLILVVGWLLTKYVIKYLKVVFEKSNTDLAVASFLLSVSRVLMYVITIIIALGQVINLTAAVAALGAAGLTASFALQGSLGNFVSGMQVIFSKPFGVGDFLSVESFSGEVTKITVLNTTLVTPDNKEVIIPNSKMTTDIVVNFTAQDKRRLDLTYSVSYSIDTDIPIKIITDLVNADERFLNEPAPIIAVGEHQDSSVQIVARIWVKSEDYWDTYFYMQSKVKKEFDAKGVEIPFPQLDVHNKN